MISERVRSKAGVCLVGGGDVCPEVLAKALKFAPDVVAADGGADTALKANLDPLAVIGDFDSISTSAKTAIGAQKLMAVHEQDSTDFEKCLARIDAPFVIAVGFTGRRLDHTLAALSVLARHIGPPTLLLDRYDAVLAPRGPLTLGIDAGVRVSLFPMARTKGRSRGLYWPIDGLEFSPSSRVGTSNMSTGPVEMAFEQAGMLVMLPAAESDAFMPALRG